MTLQGARGWAKICFCLESLYFCELGDHAKFWNPTTTPSGLLNNGGKSERKNYLK